MKEKLIKDKDELMRLMNTKLRKDSVSTTSKVE